MAIKAGPTNSSLTLERDKVLKRLMAGMKGQFWGTDEIELWDSRLLGWIKEFGSQQVNAQADWFIDNQDKLEKGILSISAFKTALVNGRPENVGKDGPFIMCKLCSNTGFYDIGNGRYAKCPHPIDKQEIGWFHRNGIDIPPGETLASMRANYLEFRENCKVLVKQRTMRLEDRKSL
jgi:hypothetical protein